MSDVSNISTAIMLLTVLGALAVAMPSLYLKKGASIPTGKDTLLRVAAVAALGVTLVSIMGNIDTKYLAQDMDAASNSLFLAASALATGAFTALAVLNAKSEKKAWTGRYGR